MITVKKIYVILACGIIFAVIGGIIGYFQFHENFWIPSLICLFFGLRIGRLITSNTPEKQEEHERIHQSIPDRMKDSYYSDLVMKRIMEVYHPEEDTSEDEETTDAEEGENITDEEYEYEEEVEETDEEAPEEEADEEDVKDDTSFASQSLQNNYLWTNEESRLTFWEIITYPTQIPITLGILWPVIFWILGLFFPEKLKDYGNLLNVISIILVPSFILITISGFLVLLQRTTVTIWGQVLEDEDSRIDASIKIIIGLAGIIYLVIFH